MQFEPDEIDFWKPREDTQMFRRFWKGSQADKTIMMLHGVGNWGGNVVQSSSGKFVGQVPAAKWLAERGSNVYSIDFVGHGKSSGPRRVDSVDQLVKDVQAMVDEIKKNSRLPLFVIGTSMGSAIAIYLKNEDGICLMCPPFRDSSNLPNPIQYRLLSILASLMGNTTMPQFLWPSKIRNVCVKDDEKLVEHLRINKETKITWLMNFKTAKVMADMCYAVREDIKELDIPFAVALGEFDPTLNVEFVTEFIQNAKTPQEKQSFKVFPTYHLMLMDDCFEIILEYFVTEMNKMMKTNE